MEFISITERRVSVTNTSPKTTQLPGRAGILQSSVQWYEFGGIWNITSSISDDV